MAIPRYNLTTYTAEILWVLSHICHLLQQFGPAPYYQEIATSASPPRNDTVILARLRRFEQNDKLQFIIPLGYFLHMGPLGSHCQQQSYGEHDGAEHTLF